MKWRTPAPASTPVRRIVGQDLRLAVIVAVLMVVGLGVSVEDDFEFAVAGDLTWPPPHAGGVLLLLAQSLALIFRRVAPVTVLAFTILTAIAYQSLDVRPVPLYLGLLVAVYTVAVVRKPLISGVGAAAFMLACTVGALTGVTPMTDDMYYTTLISVVGTVMLGYGVALGRARATLAEERTIELARAQDSRTRAAVMQEQAHIAREVHDIVAHDVSVIVAQAAAARRVFGEHPQVATDALASIESVGRDALDGLRRLVGLLRTERDDPAGGPQPTLDRLPWLLAHVERAGLPVDLTIRGRPSPLPATVELNAYRIVQESLTNIIKHAGPTRASVILEYGKDTLDVSVLDRGRGATEGAATGYGLISMQQRASMLGGELVAGPADGCGFRVSARLPVRGSAW
jgi:signal transduction histidine kinase